MAKDDNRLFLNGLDQNLEQDLSQVQDEIDSMSAKATLNGVEVVNQLIQFSSDPKEINRLAKALALIAKRLPTMNKTKNRITALKLASEDPEWFEMAFTSEAGIDHAIFKCLDQPATSQEPE